MNKMFLVTCFALAFMVDLKASENCSKYLIKADKYIDEASDASTSSFLFSKNSGLARIYMMRYNICVSKKDRGHLAPLNNNKKKD